MRRSARTLDTHGFEPPLLDAIYDAPLNPGGWTRAMKAVGDRLNAHSGFMFSSHCEMEPQAVLQVYNHAPEMPRDFSGFWHAGDPWALAARRRGLMKRETVVTGSELMPTTQYRKTPFFDGFARHHGMESMVGSVLFDGSEPDHMPFTNLCWYRPPNRVDFQEDDKAVVTHLLPHFQRALRIQRKLRALAADPSTDTALARLNMASIMLDGELRVVHCNEAGSRLLSSLGPRAFCQGQLRSIGSHCAPALPVAFAQCVATGVPVTMVARAAGLAGQQSAVVSATLVPIRPGTESHVGNQSQQRFLLLVSLPPTGDADTVRRVAEVFALTRAESRVLSGLLDGQAAADIAHETETALPTVRTHIRAIFGKTGVSRQIDLVRLFRTLGT